VGDRVRKERSSMRRRLVAVLIAATAVAAGLTMKVAATPPPSNGDLGALGTKGVPVAPTADTKQAGLASLLLLARTNGRAFYRATRADGAACFAAGNADSPGRIGFLLCGAKNFPSREVPVFAAPAIGAERAAPEEWRLLRVDGFATDGVARVAVTDEAGDVVGDVQVVDNVFSIVPSRRSGIGDLRAYDAAGHVVYSQSYR